MCMLGQRHQHFENCDEVYDCIKTDVMIVYAILMISMCHSACGTANR